MNDKKLKLPTERIKILEVGFFVSGMGCLAAQKFILTQPDTSFFGSR